MSLSLGLGLALTRNKGGWPADMTHDIDFVRRGYRYARRSYAAVTDIPGTTFTRSAAAYGDDASGNLILFASNVPRITNKGVLIEESRTNLLLRSQAFNTSPWTKGGTTSVTENAVLAPDGAVTGAAVSFPAINDNVLQPVSVSASTGPWTFSVWLKGVAGQTCRIVVDGTLSGSGYEGATLAVTLTSNWVRYSITTSFSTNKNSLQAYVQRITGQTATSLNAWGAQLEAGSFPTSYIPTTSASATRNADVLASANDPNPTAYTVVAEFTVPLLGGTSPVVWAWDDGSDNNRTLVYFDRGAGKLFALAVAGGVTQATLQLGTATPGQSYKVAFAVAANDFAAIMTGGVVQTDAAGSIPSTSNFRIGNNWATAPQLNWGSYIKRIQRYAARKTNSELQALVA